MRRRLRGRLRGRLLLRAIAPVQFVQTHPMMSARMEIWTRVEREERPQQQKLSSLLCARSTGVPWQMPCCLFCAGSTGALSSRENILRACHLSPPRLNLIRRYEQWHWAIREFPDSDSVADKEKLALKCGVIGAHFILFTHTPFCQ